MNLPEFSIKRKVTLTIITLLTVLSGLGAFFTLDFDLMPQMEQPVLTIITEYQGMSAEDVEEIVTKPIEQVISAVKGIKNIYSTSSEGKSTIVAQFEWGSDLDAKTQDIRDMIERIRKYLPSDMGNPLILKINLSQMPVLLYAVTGMSNTNELRKYLNDNISPQIDRTDGVAYSMLMGGLPREIRILLDRNKVEHYKVNSLQIIGALNYGNMNIGGGYINSGNKEYLVRTIGFFKDIKSIENTVIAASKGALIRIRDIGRVEDGFEEGRNILRVNGRDAVLLAVSKHDDAATVRTIGKVKKKVDEISSTLPLGIKFHTIYDQSQLIEQASQKVMKNIIIGGILTAALILILFRSWRKAFIIAMVLPLSIFTTFLGLKFSGNTLNMITLSGIALLIGPVLFGAVLMVENIFIHIHESQNSRSALQRCASETVKTVITFTLTTAAALLPMALGGRTAGQLTKPFVLTFFFALLSSLFFSVTLVPMLASLLFVNKTSAITNQKQTNGNSLFDKSYLNVLKWVLSRREVFLAAASLAFVGAMMIIPSIGFEFMPSADYDMALLKIKMPPGVGLAETERVVSAIEQKIRSYEGSKFVLESVGPPYSILGSAASGPFFPSDVNEATLMIGLKDRNERRAPCAQVIAEIRKAFPVLRGASLEFIDLSGDNSGGSTSQIEIKLFGKDLGILRQKAEEGADFIKDVAGLKDITVSLRSGKPELRILPDRDKASSMGLTAGEIGNDVRLSNLGQVATRYRDRSGDYNVRIILDSNYRTGIDDMRLIPVVSRFGGATPVANIAEIRTGEGYGTIQREKRTRMVKITANIQAKDIYSVVKEVKARLDKLDLPSGYSIEYGGLYKYMAGTLWYLSFAIVIAMVLIYMILSAFLESFLQPLAVILPIPVCLAGAALIPGLFGLRFSAPVFMGLIILTGISAANGIIVIYNVNRLIRKGAENNEAVISGADQSLKPVFVNSLITALGVSPMVFAAYKGTEIMKPIAVTAGYGTLISALVTVFAVPVVYSLLVRTSYGSIKNVKRAGN